MKYCAKCGNELVDEAVVCPKCGCAVANTNYAPNGNAQQESTNVFAIIGLICSFFIPLLGCVFGGIGLAKSNKMNGKGKGLSIAAIATSGAFILFALIFGLLFSIIGMVL